MTTSVSWSSAAPAVATVNSSGLVTGVTEGNSTITASAGGHSGDATVVVDDPFPPQQPSGVVATPVSNTEVQVIWADNSNNEDGFRIDREQVAAGGSSADEGFARVFSEVGTVGPNVTTFLDTGLQPLTVYKYRVKACNENGCTEPSASQNETPTFAELVIETSGLPDGFVGDAYDHTLIASGGDWDVVWSVTGGSLPAGIGLSGTGVLSGTPNAGGTFHFTIQAAAAGQTPARAFSIEVITYDCSIQSEIPETECGALVSLWESTSGMEWTTSTGWVSTPTPCSWHGVTCEGGTVRRLELEANQLTGVIPAELGNLTNLNHLTLFSNQLSGTVPLGVAQNGSRIQDSYGLSQCKLVPPGNEGLVMPDNPDYRAADLDGDGAICGVDISPSFDCSAQSEIPAGECRALVALYDHTNGPGWLNNRSWVEAATPCSWHGVSCAGGSVTRLELPSSGLSGSIPAELGGLRNLEYLTLNSNQLTGAIPSELGELGNLEALHLYDNQLTGSIPVELGNLTNLLALYLDDNELTGPIPVELEKLTNLKWLVLNTNQLTGSIPVELGNLTNLLALSLEDNRLTGQIPVELEGLESLEWLFLSRNQLTGTIPVELGGLANLRHLYVQDNQLSGTIPVELGGLTNLLSLHLYDNQLTGSIPVELGSLTNLQYLYLRENQLSGSIPAELGNLVSLRHLALRSNQLTGPIPADLGNLTNLRWLFLQENQLTGSIPAELGGLATLEELHLYDNQLTGLIPLPVAQRGGLIQAQNTTWERCVFVPPGNTGLSMPDAPTYRAADLDGDGRICGVSIGSE